MRHRVGRARQRQELAAVDAQPCQLHRRCEFSGLLLAFRANRGDAENRVRFRETGRWLEAVAIRAHGWRWWRWREMRSKAVAHAGRARHARPRPTGPEQDRTSVV